MEWSKDLYDEFRMTAGFGAVSDEQTKREVDFIRDVLELPIGARVLDLFCGAGRHSIELARRGFAATGIEYNADYLNLARTLIVDTDGAPKFIQADVRYVDYGEDYDGAIIMFNSFGYFSDEEDKLIFMKVYKSLRERGRFLIEILNRDWILKNFVESEEAEINGIRTIETREFDILTSRNNFVIERHAEDGVITKRGSWRLYSAHEIKNMLEDIGFKLIAGYGSLNKERLTKDTRLMRLVFEE